MIDDFPVKTLNYPTPNNYSHLQDIIIWILTHVYLLDTVLGFEKDMMLVSEGEDLQLSVGISEGYLDVAVNVSFYTESGTAQGIWL